MLPILAARVESGSAPGRAGNRSPQLWHGISGCVGSERLLEKTGLPHPLGTMSNKPWREFILETGPAHHQMF